MNDKIGQFFADKSAQFPKVSISGRDYNRPATTRHISPHGHFVVIDVNPLTPELEAELESLKLSLAPKTAKRVTPDATE